MNDDTIPASEPKPVPRDPSHHAWVISKMTECTLATISHLCMLSRPSRKEIERQARIAQFGINWLRESGWGLRNRCKDVADCGCAETWADRLYDEWHPPKQTKGSQ